MRRQRPIGGGMRSAMGPIQQERSEVGVLNAMPLVADAEHDCAILSNRDADFLG
jgi:hypothetical protein